MDASKRVWAILVFMLAGATLYEMVSRQKWVICLMIGHEEMVERAGDALRRDPESAGDAAAVAEGEAS